jgi:hypothetical protein
MFIQAFNEHNKAVEKLIGKDYAAVTLIKYNACLSTLESFVKQKYHEDDIPLSKLNYAFIVEFELFLKTQQACAHNTVNRC